MLSDNITQQKPLTDTDLLNATVCVASGDGIAQEHRLKSRCRIGSATEAEVTIHHPQALGYHCEIQWLYGYWQIVDLGSSEGTFLNGERIQGDAALSHGDMISVASVQLIFNVDALRENIDDCNDGVLGGFCETENRNELIIQHAAVLSPLAIAVNRSLEDAPGLNLVGRTGVVLEQILEETGGDLAYAQLIEKDDYELTNTAQLKTVASRSLRKTRWIEPDNDLCARVINSNQGILKVQRHRDTVSSVICVPITGGIKVIGLLHLFSVGNSHVFTEEQLKSCSQAGQIIEMIAQRHQLLDRIALLQQEADRQNVVRQFAVREDNSITDSRMDRDTFLKLVSAASNSQASVLVCGERGTGHERLAGHIFQASSIANARLIKFDVLDYPPSEVEQALFGDQVTSNSKVASATHASTLDQAKGGTLLLRNIHALSIRLQAKLECRIEELLNECSSCQSSLQTRFITLTTEGLGDHVSRGHLRPKLARMLSEIDFQLTPLRERCADIHGLVQKIADSCATRYMTQTLRISPAAMQALVGHSWPGNFCELTKVVEAAFLSCDSTEIRVEHLRKFDALSEVNPAFASLADLETQHIATVLAATRGNKTETAGILGICRSTLDRKIDRYKIDR